jgi:hypothetical protein
LPPIFWSVWLSLQEKQKVNKELNIAICHFSYSLHWRFSLPKSFRSFSSCWSYGLSTLFSNSISSGLSRLIPYIQTCGWYVPETTLQQLSYKSELEIFSPRFLKNSLVDCTLGHMSPYDHIHS